MKIKNFTITNWFNSKYHGVPQNRERVYTVGHLRRYGRCKVFPISGTAGEDSADIKQIGQCKSKRNNPNQYRIYDIEGQSPCLNKMDGGGLEPNIALPMPECIGGIEKGNKKFGKQFAQQDRIYDGSKVATALTSELSGNVNYYAFGIDYNKGGKELEIANTVTARNVMNGVSNVKQEGTAIAVTVGYDNGLNEITTGAYPTCNARDYKGVNFRDLGAVCIPVLTPDRINKRQNGRRMKENGEDAFTLTAQDIHGVAIGTKVKIREATAKGYAEAEVGDSVNLSMPESKTRRGRVGKKQANTLDTSCEQGVIVPVPVIWYDKYKCYIAIRKLTPRECFRLQGWTDDYFEKAQFVNSDSQLYKQAGNGVTVNVVYEIAKAIGG